MTDHLAEKALAYLKARGDADEEIAARGVASPATKEAVVLRALDLADSFCVVIGTKLTVKPGPRDETATNGRSS